MLITLALIIKNNNHGSLLCNNHVDFIARSLAHSDQSVAVSDTVLRALLGLLHQILTVAVRGISSHFDRCRNSGNSG